MVLHEVLPDECRPVVLRHQHGNALIDADHVNIGPVGERVERVNKPVALPRPQAVSIVEVGEARDGFPGLERNRTSGGTRYNGAVWISNLGWAAPNLVTEPRIGSGNAPSVL